MKKASTYLLLFVLSIMLFSTSVTAFAGPGGDGGGGSCFPAGTQVSLPDGSTVNIEDVKVGDIVLSYNMETGQNEPATVLELESPVREGYYILNDGLLRVTNEHPIYVQKPSGEEGWASIDPAFTAIDSTLEVMQLEVGDFVKTIDGYVELITLEYVEGDLTTYNLKSVSGHHTFYADSVLVHNKDHFSNCPPGTQYVCRPQGKGDICTCDPICRTSTHACGVCGTQTFNTCSGWSACNDPCAPVCGDGNVDEGEQCDDGNENNNDGCRNDCTFPVCGDGIVDEGEVCDNGELNGQVCDPNELDEDLDEVCPEFCNSDCTVPFCGDGNVDEGEQCDDGNDDNFDACNNSCEKTFCGDDKVQDPNGFGQSEVCDDGVNNGVPCDPGYNGICTFCTDVCEPDEREGPFCGDGIVDEPFEQCDDGNLDNNDFCNNWCEYTFCGDGYLNPGEFCDDGNNVDGDGCSSTCDIEECRYDSDCDDGLFCNGYEICDQQTYTCEPGEVVECDNGLFCDGQEVCDELIDQCKTINEPQCDDGLFCNGVEVCNEHTDTCDPGVVVDCSGNNIPGVGTCTHSPDDNDYTWDWGAEFISTCDEANDMCTDGNQTLYHTCDGFCGSAPECVGKQPGQDGCDEICQFPKCGDGNVDPGEQCDDGNLDNTDSCNNQCEFTFCGDGYLNPDEFCDDGNNVDGDGCSATCEVEECRFDSDCSDGLFCNGEEVCDQQTFTCEPGVIVECDNGLYCDGYEVCNEDIDSCESVNVPQCDNGLFCDGVEYCDESLDSCQPGEVVTCDNGLYCDGLEVCDESIDSCVDGNPISCDNGLFCDGVEYCDESLDSCQPGTDVVCDNGLFCDGFEYCDENLDSCEDGQAVQCDDGLFCNGVEVCNEQIDQCNPGVIVDCSGNNIPGVSTCTHSPDDNTYTWDWGAQFISTCNEDSDMCTDGTQTLYHTCDSFCGAAPECSGKNPGEDGCDDNCQFPHCGDGIVNNNEQCDDGNQDNTDSCNNWCEFTFCGDGYLNAGESCDDGNNDNGDGCSATCEVEECRYDSDCSDGLFCNGEEVCNQQTFTCEPGEVVECENGLYCDGQEVCNEELDRCDAIHVPTCDDGLYCNGLEVCNEHTDSCDPGVIVDCSGNNIPEVGTCTHSPDDNSYTWDWGDEFVSVCVEATDSCSEGSQTLYHICDTFCGADAACQGKNPGQDGCDSNCQMRECSVDADCDNSLYCDGVEYCDQQTYTCQNSDPVICDDGLYCNGVETCNEHTDSCDQGEAVICDNGLYCDGLEYCDESLDSCQDSDPVICDDGLYCNGVESCNEGTDSCDPGVTVDCSANDIDGIDSCTHNPDSNDYTKDARVEFISVCNEASDSCTEGDDTITHICDSVCGADVACQGKNPGQDGCDSNCQMRECSVDADCDNGLFCDGQEYCDQQTYTCQTSDPVVCDDGLYCNGVEYCDESIDACNEGAVVVCDNGLFCDGVETCNEQTDSCEAGDVVVCDDGQFCNGLEVCDETTDSCDSGEAVVCDNGLFCDGIETCDESQDSCVAGEAITCDNGLYCDGVETCDERTDSCAQGTPIQCNDGLFCNGVESCNEGTDSCDSGVAIDCSANNIPGVNTCTNDPDNNQYTKDFRSEFVSSCNEQTDSCTIGNEDLEHTCDVNMCGAECSEDSQCAATDCDWLDGCYGDFYLDFSDEDNYCSGGCSCSDNYCKNPVIIPNDPRCVIKECEVDADCDNGLYCDGQETCNTDTFMCEGGQAPTCDNGLFCDGVETCNEDTDSCDQGDAVVCDNGLFCDGVETCSEAEDKCVVGDPVVCDDGLYCNGFEICDEAGDQCVTDALIPIDDGIACTEDVCDEENDVVTHTPKNSLCDDGLFCNGEEVCHETLGCMAGTIVDCSANNIDGISSCTNDPDANDLTLDFRAEFISSCDEQADSCTVGDDTITHTCDLSCGSDQACDGVAPGTEGCTASCEEKQCTTDADCDNGLFCDGAETCDLQTFTCVAGTAPTVDDGVSCTADSCDEVNDVIVHAPDNTVCNDGLFCNGQEVCDITNGCVAGEIIDCSANDIGGIDSCTHSPDGISTTRDVRVAFDSVCDEQTDSCTLGDDTITHTCDLTCGAESQCDGVAPSTNDCSFECKFKPPKVCEHDGVYSNDKDEGHQFVCRPNNTYDECNADGSAYVHVNVCAFECSAHVACDGTVPGDSLEACDITGDAFLEDYCDTNCQLQESTCESGYAGCTADVACDESVPGEGACSLTCQQLECRTNADCDNGLFCDGLEVCDLQTNTCQSGQFVACDDGIFCNGIEVCDEATDSCSAGVAIDCSVYNIPGVNSCTNDPDGNDHTLDFRAEFISTCNEVTDSCTTGIETITHTCDLVCGAECSSDAQCSGTTCEDKNGCYLHGNLVVDPQAECFGDTACEKREYESAAGFCDLNTCGCTGGACTDFTVTETDADNDGFDVMCDLDCDDNNPDVNPGAAEICDGLDNNCNGEVDEHLYGGDFRISYSTRSTGDIKFIEAFDTFEFERIDFFHGYVHERDGTPLGFGSLAARGTTPDGQRINLNVKFDVTEIIDRNCMTITWRNEARGTFWIKDVSRDTFELAYMDITYNLVTGEIDAVGVGDVPFDFEDMIDRNFNP